jgi:ABC-type glutathione transport system ATPase component
MEYAIEIDELKKDFKDDKIITHVLRGLNMKIRQGKIVTECVM